MAKAKYKLKDILAPGFELPDSRSDLMAVYRTAEVFILDNCDYLMHLFAKKLSN